VRLDTLDWNRREFVSLAVTVEGEEHKTGKNVYLKAFLNAILLEDWIGEQSQ
jgi:hypothetical protein